MTSWQEYLLLLFIIWAITGFFFFIRLHSESQKIAKKALAQLEQEKQLDVPSGVQYYNQRFDLENSNRPLIILYNEYKKSKWKYFSSNIIKSMIIGPFYLAPIIMTALNSTEG
ncbi:hypothetical protein [Tetragenococcus halophilus]|uniref:hypothetical protein n=1 Tax=Tetragenococcus halophilus TaxID=51669 RepID=UPI00300FBD2D